MELNEEEKRQLFQVDGDCQAKVLDELYTMLGRVRKSHQWSSCISTTTAIMR